MLRVLIYKSLFGFLSCNSPDTQEVNNQPDDQIYAPISGKLIYLNDKKSFKQGDTMAIMDTSILMLEKRKIRTLTNAWNRKRISHAGHTEATRLSLGHKFYLQSQIKQRLKEGEVVPMVERNINDYEIMYYQEKMRYGLKEVERENQFINAQLELLEVELKQIDLEIETCYLISMKEAQLVGLRPMQGRWYPQGALLMELEF